MNLATEYTQSYPIKPVTSTLTAADHWDHFLARMGVKRGGHRVEPGLYALRNPNPDSPVFVTANYTLSFDALRAALVGMDAYILVLDTKGVNVWCAAGEGTFGTDELVQRIEESCLKEVVHRRVVILPQLGAPGVAAQEVKKRSGFKVEYGPVRASDLPEYMKTREATPEMRMVRFPLIDRLVLIPVELKYVLLPMLIAGLILTLSGAPLVAGGVVTAMLAGAAFFPILLPWLPTSDFSSKGFILGGLVTLPFVLSIFLNQPQVALWRQIASGLALLLALPPLTAYLALNFTGATTFTSRTGVRREMYTYLPFMAWMFGIGLVLYVALIVIRA